jgi:hypothetical protein
VDPYNPNAFDPNAFGPDGQPPQPQPPLREDIGTYGSNTIDGMNVIGSTVDGVDPSGIADVVSGAADIAGDVASGAADAVGGLAEGIGAVAEGCGSCSLAVLVMLFVAISTAFALAQ